MNENTQPLVGIIMGSDSDWPTMEAAYQVCQEFKVPCEVKVVSAHRTPDDMARYAKTAHQRGLRVIIAGAGGAAHLPGMVASHTPLPVIGVPVEGKSLKGLDSLLSIVQMPGGIPVATVAIGGAKNAGLLAVAILGASDGQIRAQMMAFKRKLASESRARGRKLQASLQSSPRTPSARKLQT
jgi:5-(carboxyamino)imidazole ribonucleotide mutase